jgi:heavy metal efflux system protein
MWKRRFVVPVAGIFLIASLSLFLAIGGEFMPKLEEGNLWVRTTLPQDISFDYATRLADEIRKILGSFPEVTQIVSQVGRPDDGSDTTTFNNIDFQVDLKPESSWKSARSKEELIQKMNEGLQRYPGIAFNFSQNIQDNVAEAMSGVKGENSIKLFGDDIMILAKTAARIQTVMGSVPGITDLGVAKVTGQPNLVISIDRTTAGRYGRWLRTLTQQYRRRLEERSPLRFWRATAASISSFVTNHSFGRTPTQ